MCNPISNSLKDDKSRKQEIKELRMLRLDMNYKNSNIIHIQDKEHKLTKPDSFVIFL